MSGGGQACFGTPLLFAFAGFLGLFWQGPGLGKLVKRESFVMAFSDTFAVIGAVLVIAAIILLLARRGNAAAAAAH